MADDPFSVELALDRLEGELAAVLPTHMRGFARAYAENQATPAAPTAAQRPASLELALRAFRMARAIDSSARESGAPVASAHESARSASTRGSANAAGLGARAIALLRLLMPIAIESDERVARARAIDPSWDAWDALGTARDHAARSRFGIAHVKLMHWSHGATSTAAASTAAASTAAASTAWPEPLDGWHDRVASIGPAFVERAWRDIADRHAARGTCRIVHAPEARPRAFVVEPGRDVIVVVGAIDSPAHRFAAVHELGHAVAALLVPGTLPRVVDEAAAAYVARLVEHEGALDLPWFTPVATPARARRRQMSAALDAIERGSPERPTAKPPWALWHDPGAQAAYVEAETIADRWWIELGAMPATGAFGAALVAERTRVERAQTGSALIA